MTQGFNGKQFQTAARRRQGKPITFVIGIWRDDPGHIQGGYEEDVELRVDPLIDVVLLGASFGSFGQVLSGLSDTTVDSAVKTAEIRKHLPLVRETLREMILPPDRAKWDEHGPALDTRALGELVQWISREVSGMDPTQQASSSDGSVPTGTTSMGTPAPGA